MVRYKVYALFRAGEGAGQIVSLKGDEKGGGKGGDRESVKGTGDEERGREEGGTGGVEDRTRGRGRSEGELSTATEGMEGRRREGRFSPSH